MLLTLLTLLLQVLPKEVPVPFMLPEQELVEFQVRCCIFHERTAASHVSLHSSLFLH
jgi:hypothetical protein